MRQRYFRPRPRHCVATADFWRAYSQATTLVKDTAYKLPHPVMKIIRALVIPLILLIVVAACQRPEDNLAREMRQEASAKMAAACSNAVPSIVRIVRLDFNMPKIGSNLVPSPPQEWRGAAEVDFINGRGAIERTNLALTFDSYVTLDYRNVITCTARPN